MVNNIIQNKKAELTTTQIVTIIVLIISFVVLLLFFWQFNWGEETDKEVCHNSVALRSSLSEAKEVVPLKCQTQQVCLSMGEECEGIVAGATKIKVRDENEIIGELVNLMYDCWWQMGEGELDYQPRDFEGNNYCAMCSVIYFDKTIEDTYPEISNRDIFGYMQNNNVPTKDESYLQYFYETDSIEYVRQQVAQGLADNSENDLLYGFIDTSKQSAILTSMSKKGNFWESLASGVGAAGVGLVFLPLVGATGHVLVIKTLVGTGAGFFAGHMVTRDEGIYMKPIIIPYDADEIISKLECSEFSTLY